MKYSLTILILLTWCFAAFTITGDGSPVDYSKMALSARYWGMGQAGVGFADDSGGVMLNPASYGVMRSLELGVMNTQLLGEFTYTYFSGVWPLPTETLGFSFLNENPGTIYGASNIDQYGHPQQGDILQAYSQMIGIGYGRKAFLDNLYLGGMFKYSRQQLDFVQANASSMDLGALYRWDQDIAFGLTAKNILQSAYSYTNISETASVDPELIGGVAWTFLNKSFILAVDRHVNTTYSFTNFGLEYWLGEMVSFRAGMADKNFSLGLGFKWDLFKIDYAMQFQDAPLENEAFISVSYGNASSFLLSKPEIEIVENGNTGKPNTPSADTKKSQSGTSGSDGIQVIE